MKNEFSMEEKIDILIETTAQIKEHLFVHDQRFDQIDRRFDGIDQRLDYHEDWLKRIDKNLENCVIKPEFNKLLNRFDTLVGTLEKSNVISSYDAAHISYTKID